MLISGLSGSSSLDEGIFSESDFALLILVDISSLESVRRILEYFDTSDLLILLFASLKLIILENCFCINGSGFLAEAVITEKYNIRVDQADKGFFYSFGLIEGFETICFFLFICFFPNLYANAAYIFFVLTLFTHVVRILKSFNRFL